MKTSENQSHTATVGAAPLPWATTHDSDLYRLVAEDGRPLILFGRSASSCLNAASDLHQAADELYRVAGLDARAVLPSEDQLEDMLVTEGSQGDDRLDPEGRYMAYREPRLPLVVCLSTARGSGPVPFHLVDIFHTIVYSACRPAGVFASSTDRYSRNREALAQFESELTRAHAADELWVGDGAIGRWDLRA